MKKIRMAIGILLLLSLAGCSAKVKTETGADWSETIVTQDVQRTTELPETQKATENMEVTETTEAEVLETTEAEVSKTMATEATESFVTEAERSSAADPGEIVDVSKTLYPYDEMCEDLNVLCSVFPNLVSQRSAGVSADGRDLKVAVFGNPQAQRQILICAATHAREYMTVQLVMKQLEYNCRNYDTGAYNGRTYADLFSSTCFYLVPMVNPDGVSISQFGLDGLRSEELKTLVSSIYQNDLASGYTTEDFAVYLTRWKANARGVDLNRNYEPGWENAGDTRPSPSSSFYKGTAFGSEAESRMLMALLDELSNPLLVLSYHSYGDLVYYQYGQPEPLYSQTAGLAQNISNLTGYYLAGYSNEAGFSNYCAINKGLMSVTVETGNVPAPLPQDQFARLWSSNQEMWAMLASSY